MPTLLVTGAGRGLGFEFARQYAAAGWRVIGTVRGTDAAGSLRGIGVESHLMDVTDRAAIARLAAALRGTPIDVLICNSGIRGRLDVRFGALDYEEWERVLRVNVLGAAAVAEALVENVAASERKVLAMMSSRLGSIAESRGAEFAYASSKAALNAVMKAMSLALASRGITVVSLAPGWVRTDMGGPAAALAPEESIGGLRRVIDGLTIADSGKFLSYEGRELPW